MSKQLDIGNRLKLELKVAKLYGEGNSLVSVAQSIGLSAQTIWLITKKLGITRTRTEARRGRYHCSEVTKKRISTSRLNKHYHFPSKYYSKETREKIRVAALKRHHSKQSKMKIAQSVKRYISQLSPEEQIERARKWIRAAGARPNSGEQLLYDILQKHFPNQWKYTGKGGFVIDGKIPDFVNINGKKQVIELFGEHWHKVTDVQKRINLFARFGFNTLIVWGSELRNENLVVDKIKQFSN